jgi:transitional endoplasmic reticulum ATPase
MASLSDWEEPIPSLYVKSFCRQGEGISSIRNIFTHARLMAPCLLVFEDLDSLVTDHSRSYFLNEVDGLESNDGILMIGSTNHLETLDPAITKRPSRFDRKYHFRLPDEYERCAYIKFWQSKLQETNMVDFPDELCSVIARMSENFSFAYLKELFVMALLSIARGGTGDEDTEKPVMVQRADALAPTESEQEADEDDKEDDDQKYKKKHVIPDVEIPQSLQNSVLLKVLRIALVTLVDEMDSTPEHDWPSTKRQTGGFGQAQPVTIVQSGSSRRMGIY